MRTKTKQRSLPEKDPSDGTLSKEQSEATADLEAFFSEVESYKPVVDTPMSPEDDKALLGEIRQERFGLNNS